MWATNFTLQNCTQNTNMISYAIQENPLYRKQLVAAYNTQNNNNYYKCNIIMAEIEMMKIRAMNINSEKFR
jgi:hypothetical protein